MAKVSAAPGWQRALMVLTGTVVGVVVVSCLYWAQTVFIPVALAVFLTFLLAPLVTILQRRHLGRLPSVILVVLLAALVLGGVVWLVTVEVTSLAGELPKYTENIKGKDPIAAARWARGRSMEHLEKMIQDIAAEWNSQPASPEGGTADQPAGRRAPAEADGRGDAAGEPALAVAVAGLAQSRWWSRSAAWPWPWYWSCSCC